MSRDPAIDTLATLYETRGKVEAALERADATGTLKEEVQGHDSQGCWFAVAQRADEATWERVLQEAVHQHPRHPGWRNLDLDVGRVAQYAQLADRLNEGELRLEAKIDDTPELVDAIWFAHGKNAVDAVCLLSNFQAAKKGTGFLALGGPTGGLIVTNEHVIASNEEAENTNCEFRTYAASTDDTRVEVEPLGPSPRRWAGAQPEDLAFVALPAERVTALRERFGAVRLRPAGRPKVGDRVMVIQHPKGGAKQVSLFKGEVLAVDGIYVRYSAHTEDGSSGGLVVDLMWRPVAVHHAGRPGHYNEGIHIDVVNARLDAILQGP
jgi:S1-C subfamily serine protease